jgi:hypothetical protein
LNTGIQSQTNGILGIEVFHSVEFDGQIEIRAKRSDGVDCSTSMSTLDGEGVLHSVQSRPLKPAPLIGRDRADQNTIHIEEDSANNYALAFHLGTLDTLIESSP